MDYSLIIKLTNACNLNCSYCYHRRDSNRNFHLSFSMEQLETMIRGIMAHNEHHVEFIWHGGEPLLAGIDTFREIINLQKKYNSKDLKIRNNVQSNGTLMTSAFIDFFRENHFNIGISIDGPFDMHTSERGTSTSEYEKIMAAIDELSLSYENFGTLCVVGKQHIGQAERVFHMLEKHGIKNIGFLPCVVHTNGKVDMEQTIAPKEFAEFLIYMFEIWVHGDTKGMSIREFDDCIRFFRGKAPHNCVNCNGCDQYLTVTPDGKIYLCDNFCASEEHQVGHINQGFDCIDETRPMVWLKQTIQSLPTGCAECKYFKACNGGCKYYRWLANKDMQTKQFFCQATQMLYDHVAAYFEKGDE